MISHLAFLPFPLDNESPTSAIQRTARANGFHTCYELFKYLRKATTQLIRANVILANSTAARAIYLCAPHMADRLSSNFYTPSHSFLKLPNAIIHDFEVEKTNLRLNETAFCSECFKEGWERYPKDIILFAACPFHDKQYLIDCPQCGKKLYWQQMLEGTCTCKHSLNSPVASAHDIRDAHFLLSLFRDGESVPFNSIQNTLKSLRKNTYSPNPTTKIHLTRLAIAITRDDLEDIIQSIHNCLPCRSNEDINIITAILQPCMNILTLSKTRHRLLATQLQQGTSLAGFRISLRTLLNHLGINYQIWYKIKHHFAFLKLKEYRHMPTTGRIDSVQKVLNSTLQPDVNNASTQKVKSVVNRDKQIVSIKDFSALTGLPIKSIPILARKTGFFGAIHKSKWPCRVIGKFWAQSFDEKYVCAQQIARELKIKLYKVTHAIEAINIRIPECNFPGAPAIILRTDHARLIEQLLRPPPFTAPSNPHKKFSTNLPFVESSKNIDLLSGEQCAKFLSIEFREIKNLIRLGILPCHVKGRNGKYLIATKDAVQFSNSTIRPRELSTLLHIAQKRVASVLVANGVSPITGPLAKNGRTHFFKKIDITPKLINELANLKTPGQANTNTKHHLPKDHSSLDHPITMLCKKYNISSETFYNRFLKAGIIEHQKHCGERCISEKAHNKIEHLCRDYVTCREADAILFTTQGYTRSLLKSGRLISITNPYAPTSKIKLILRVDIDALKHMKYGASTQSD